MYIVFIRADQVQGGKVIGQTSKSHRVRLFDSSVEVPVRRFVAQARFKSSQLARDVLMNLRARLSEMDAAHRRERETLLNSYLQRKPE